jgi:hypothetical protein
MRYFGGPTTTTTWHSNYEDALPEDKHPLELRPSLEKGEDSHVRDCLVWHSPRPLNTQPRFPGNPDDQYNYRYLSLTVRYRKT